MRKALKRATDFCEFGTRIAVGLSGKRRKVSEVTFNLDFATAEEIHQAFMDMMLENSEENKFCNLRANPEHFLLKGLPDQNQEVIEISAGLSFPSRFIISYGDETGLTTKPDSDYPFQAAGIAGLEDGTVIGGVRHQMKNVDKGCQIKLMVEFPAILPDSYIQAHEKHLACEFYNWFSDFEKVMSESKKDRKEEKHEQ